MASANSIAARIEAEKAKIAAAQKRVADLKKKELARIAKLAEAAGVMEVEISDEQYHAAFAALVTAAANGSTTGNGGTVTGSNEKPSESLAVA